MTAARKRVKRYDTASVQGEGSYIVLRRPLYGRTKNFGKGLELEEIETLLCELLIEWNWVDDDGRSLPLPSEDKSVLDQLTDEEFLFLAKALGGDAEELKN